MRELPNIMAEILPYDFMWKQLSFETLMDGRKGLDVTFNYWWVAGVTGALYLVAIKLGRKMMENRKPFDLKIPLALWNLTLSIGSAMAFVRLLPYLFFTFYNSTLSHAMCHRPTSTYLHGSFGFWSMMFLYSKFAELIDTAFLVLRKKQVPFIHWFHHLTVLCYCWDAYSQHNATGFFFVIMNVFVHSIMYFYYFLAAVSTPPRWGKLVTNIQILQMLGGCSLVVTQSYYILKYGLAKPYDYFFDAPPAGIDERSLLAPISPPEAVDKFFTENGCAGSLSNLVFCIFIYSSYLVLFVQFAIKKYSGDKKRRERALEAKSEQPESILSAQPASTGERLQMMKSKGAVVILGEKLLTNGKGEEMMKDVRTRK